MSDGSLPSVLSQAACFPSVTFPVKPAASCHRGRSWLFWRHLGCHVTSCRNPRKRGENFGSSEVKWLILLSEADARRQTAEVTALKAADQRTACAPDVSPYLAHAYQSSVFIRRTLGWHWAFFWGGCSEPQDDLFVVVSIKMNAAYCRTTETGPGKKGGGSGWPQPDRLWQFIFVQMKN